MSHLASPARVLRDDVETPIEPISTSSSEDEKEDEDQPNEVKTAVIFLFFPKVSEYPLIETSICRISVTNSQAFGLEKPLTFYSKFSAT